MGRGTIRRMVEGARHALGDSGQHSVQIPHDVGSNEADNTIAMVFHVSVARRIAVGAVAVIVCGTINLDHQPGVANEEIRNIWADRVLAADLEPESAAPNLIP